MINPVYINGKRLVWTLGDQKVVSWKTDLPVFNVSIWQQSPLGGSAYSRGNVYGRPEEEPTTRNRKTDKSQPKSTNRIMCQTLPGLSNSTALIWIIHPHSSSRSTRPDQAAFPRPISTLPEDHRLKRPPPRYRPLPLILPPARPINPLHSQRQQSLHLDSELG